MAVVTGSTTTYEIGTAGGNREDLEDVIWDLFAEDTWALTNLDKVEADGTFHEWLTQSLAAPGANAQIEGNSETYATLVAPTRLGNYAQISDKLFLVSRTQEKVAKAGRRSEIQRAAMLKMRELKNDMEFALVRNQASTAGGVASARSSAGMESWLSTNETEATANASSTTPGFSSGTVAAPTDAATTASTGSLTITLLSATIEDCWSAGGMASVILTSAAQKSVMNGFTSGLATKNVDMSVGAPTQHALISASDVLVTSFGNHQIVLHRLVRTNVVLCIDPSYWAIAFLDRPFVEPYAKTSDGEKRHMAAEYCLVSRNEKASGKIVALTVPS